jgi:hypothetical protein
LVLGESFTQRESGINPDKSKQVPLAQESIVFRHDIGGSSFYVKRYHSTKGLRSWLGWSRIRIEWKNLLLFKRLGVYQGKRYLSVTDNAVMHRSNAALPDNQSDKSVAFHSLG